MLNRATALLNFADADAQFQRRYCSISPAEALNFNAICSVTPHDNGEHEIGIYLSPDYRGKGLAVEFLQIVMEHYSEIHGIQNFIYRAKSYNIASQKVANALGAVKIEDEGDLFRKRLIALVEDYDKSFLNEFINELDKDYDPERENVIIYRIDI